MSGERVFAPGQRVEIRGAEWVVQRADAASSREWSLQCLGLSELSLGREARFFSRLARKYVRVLDPTDMKPVADAPVTFCRPPE